MENNTQAPRLIDLDAKTLMGADVEADISADLPMRQWLYAWLLNLDIPGNYQNTLDKWIGLLLQANLFTLAFYHVPAVFAPSQALFQVFELVSTPIFSFENF